MLEWDKKPLFPFCGMQWFLQGDAEQSILKNHLNIGLDTSLNFWVLIIKSWIEYENSGVLDSISSILGLNSDGNPYKIL